MSGMVASPPGPTGADAREHHHLMHVAVAEIVNTLQGYVQAADEIKRHLLNDEDEDI